MVFQSCDDTEEILPYQEAVKQTTVAIDGLSTFLDFANIGTATAGYRLDDIGGVVTANEIDVYVQHKGANGNSDRALLKTVSSLPSDEMYTAAELAAAVGLPLEDLQLGDSFCFSYILKGSDGKVHNSSDTFVMDISCPSDLAGTYTAVSSGQSTDPCCPDKAEDIQSAEITIEAKGGGIYSITDFSGGLWNHWYGPDGGNYGASNVNAGEFKDVCNNVTMQNTTELFGSPISGTGTYDPETQTITIEWLADSWGDAGTSVFSKK